jgi:hypothetical protein
MNLKPETEAESVYEEAGRLLAAANDKLFICHVMCRFMPDEAARQMRQEFAAMGEVKKLLEVVRRLVS